MVLAATPTGEYLVLQFFMSIGARQLLDSVSTLKKACTKFLYQQIIYTRQDNKPARYEEEVHMQLASGSADTKTTVHKY